MHTRTRFTPCALWGSRHNSSNTQKQNTHDFFLTCHDVASESLLVSRFRKNQLLESFNFDSIIAHCRNFSALKIKSSQGKHILIEEIRTFWRESHVQKLSCPVRLPSSDSASRLWTTLAYRDQMFERASLVSNTCGTETSFRPWRGTEEIGLG